jgi:hypothetical protein
MKESEKDLQFFSRSGFGLPNSLIAFLSTLQNYGRRFPVFQVRTEATWQERKDYLSLQSSKNRRNFSFVSKLLRSLSLFQDSYPDIRYKRYRISTSPTKKKIPLQIGLSRPVILQKAILFG